MVAPKSQQERSLATQHQGSERMEEQKVATSSSTHQAKTATKKGTRYRLNISKAHHADALMEALVAESKGTYTKTIDPDNSDFKWVPPAAEDAEIYKILENDKNRIINRYPKIKDLGRKDQFQTLSSIASEIDPDAFDFVPPSFTFPEDAKKFLAYQKKHKNVTYIAKPLAGAQGDSIVLFQDQDKLPYSLKDQMVVQRYIDNPLLVDGFKFDLRIYVIVTGINEGDMHAFIADEGLARFCTEKYQKPTKENFKKIYMHLTNYSLNKMSDDYVKEEDVPNILEPNDGSKRTLTALFKQIAQ